MQIPTTLLSQVDSAVGGKTAINAAHGKNLIGAFYQPTMVIADISALTTLPLRELQAGYAEVVKYGLIGDKDFFGWLDANGEKLLEQNSGADEKRYAVRVSCQAKSDIVQRDETEQSARALLNLGHTFGHALEATYGYSDALLHGEGVSIGMVLAFEYSARLGLCDASAADELRAHLKKLGLMYDLSQLPQNAELTAANLAHHMTQDKKVEAGALTLILANAIGDSILYKNASLSDIEAFLASKFA